MNAIINRFSFCPGRFVVFCFFCFSLITSFTVFSYIHHIDKLWESWDQYRGLYLSANYESAISQLKEIAHCSIQIDGIKYVLFIWFVILVYNALLYFRFERFEKKIYSDVEFIGMRRYHVVMFLGVFVFFALDVYFYWHWLTYAYKSVQEVALRALLVGEPTHADFEALKRLIYRLDNVRRSEYESYRVVGIFGTLLVPLIKYVRIKPGYEGAVKHG